MTEIDSAISANARRVMQQFLDTLTIDPFIPSITAWARQYRYLSPGLTEHPGMWDPEFVSYILEIQENLHIDSPIRITIIMKSTQSLGTTSIENAIGHSIKYGIHNMLYTISSLDMAKMRSSAAIDPMIDHAGLQQYIKPITRREGQRKSADTRLYKELSGGRRFMMTSYNSIADLKSFSWDFIIMDELDEAPPELKDQGDPETIIEKRGQTIDNLKIVKISTPKDAGESRIWKAFKSGDQREYMIPCPRCGGYQFLEMMKENRNHGLYGDYAFDKRKRAFLVPGSVRYKCIHCGKDFYEQEKPGFMRERSLGGPAYWEPQAVSQDPRDRSYHISAIMSPMTKWNNIISDYLKTDFGKKVQDYKNFMITNEGLPYFPNRVFKPWEELRDRAEPYPLGIPPDGVLIIFGGVDVHKNRLELQLVGYGTAMEAWSFDHQVFYGTVADIRDTVWSNLQRYAQRYFTLPGIPEEVEISGIGVDISYNPNQDQSLHNEVLRLETNAAMSFCKMHKGLFIPLKGMDERKFDSTRQGIIRQINRPRDTIVSYLVDVSSIKTEIFEHIDLTEGPYAIHFSRYYEDEVFRQFLSEIYMEDKDGIMRYTKLYERNELLDTFIYARAVAEIKGISRWTDDDWDRYKMGLLQEEEEDFS